MPAVTFTPSHCTDADTGNMSTEKTIVHCRCEFLFLFGMREGHVKNLITNPIISLTVRSQQELGSWRLERINSLVLLKCKILNCEARHVSRSSPCLFSQIAPLEVNGISGNVHRMYEALRQEGVIELVVTWKI